MSKFGFDGTFMSGKRPKLGKAYCAGRAASYAAAAITTNPHVANTPEWQAWRSGHVSYASAGANTVMDTCTQPAKFNAPTVVAAEDSAGPAGDVYRFTPAAPGLPFSVEFGDGYWYKNPAASVASFLHLYTASGHYVVRVHYMGRVWHEETLSIVVTP